MAMSSALPAPTVAEARRMDLIVQGGCICCWDFAELGSACEVHHLTEGGKHGQPRRGHAFTLGLCPWHHRGVVDGYAARLLGEDVSPAILLDRVGPSYAQQPSAFRREFGGDDRLLELQSARLVIVCAQYLIHPGRYADPARTGGFAP